MYRVEDDEALRVKVQEAVLVYEDYLNKQKAESGEKSEEKGEEKA